MSMRTSTIGSLICAHPTLSEDLFSPVSRVLELTRKTAWLARVQLALVFRCCVAYCRRVRSPCRDTSLKNTPQKKRCWPLKTGPRPLLLRMDWVLYESRGLLGNHPFIRSVESGAISLVCDMRQQPCVCMFSVNGERMFAKTTIIPEWLLKDGLGRLFLNPC